MPRFDEIGRISISGLMMNAMPEPLCKHGISYIPSRWDLVLWEVPTGRDKLSDVRSASQ